MNDGNLYLCTDYHGLIMLQLNITLFSNHFSHPEALQKLTNTRVFCRLDVAFHLYLKRISGKIIFPTTSGFYEYLAMPYGFVYAPSVF